MAARPDIGLGPRGRKPTVRDVARAAEVSPATVSNVLTGRRNVDPAIRLRVTAAVAELGYHPDRVASSLRSTARTVVGMLVPELTNPFFAGLVERLEGEARAAGKRLLIAASGGDPEEEAKEVAALVAWRPAGVVVVPCDGRFAARALLERDGVPFVVVDRPLSEGEPVDTVAVDNRPATEVAARRLLAAGHRHLLVVASSLALGNMQERVAGIRGALAGTGAGGSGTLEVVEAGFDPEGIAAAVAGALRGTPAVTAAFALNNVLTLGTLRAAEATGRPIPESLSLLGFDDYDWMEVFRPPLSVVRQPVAELAEAAWRRLALRMGLEGPAPELEPCHVRLPCHLVWRGSVVPPRGCGSGTAPVGRGAAANPTGARESGRGRGP